MGPQEMALYRSRGGEVSAVEHLAHTEAGYLHDAGGGGSDVLSLMDGFRSTLLEFKRLRAPGQ